MYKIILAAGFLILFHTAAFSDLLPTCKEDGDAIHITQIQHEDYNPSGPSTSTNCGPASLAMCLRALGYFGYGNTMGEWTPEDQIDHARALMFPEDFNEDIEFVPPNAEDSYNKGKKMINRVEYWIWSNDHATLWPYHVEDAMEAIGGSYMIIENQDDLDFALNNGMPVIYYGYLDTEWRKARDEDDLNQHWGGDIFHFIAVTGKIDHTDASDTEYIVNDPMYKLGSKIMTYEQLEVFFSINGIPIEIDDNTHSYGLYWKPVTPFAITKSDGKAYIFVRDPRDNLLYVTHQHQVNRTFWPLVQVSNSPVSGNPVAVERSNGHLLVFMCDKDKRIIMFEDDGIGNFFPLPDYPGGITYFDLAVNKSNNVIELYARLVDGSMCKRSQTDREDMDDFHFDEGWEHMSGMRDTIRSGPSVAQDENGQPLVFARWDSCHSPLACLNQDREWQGELGTPCDEDSPWSIKGQPVAFQIPGEYTVNGESHINTFARKKNIIDPSRGDYIIYWDERIPSAGPFRAGASIHFPVSQAVPGIVTYSDTQASLLHNDLTVFTRGVDNRLYWCYNREPGIGWSPWYTNFFMEFVLTSHPAVGRFEDGRTFVAGYGADEKFYYRVQDNYDNDWINWRSVDQYNWFLPQLHYDVTRPKVSVSGSRVSYIYYSSIMFTIIAWDDETGVDYVLVDGNKYVINSLPGEKTTIAAFTVHQGSSVMKEIQVFDKAGNVTTVIQFFYNYGLAIPGQDHPDDNYSVATPYSGDTIFPAGARSGVSVGILMRGYFMDASEFIHNAGEDTGLVFTDFDPWRTIQQYPVLVIPSGGLYGLENSETFRTRLEEYTRLGGKIIMFAQQYGEDYSVLPGGKVQGYGWQQDISCSHASLYIEEWHPVFSGFTSSTITTHVDGYFSHVPDDYTVLLSRTANGQPGAIMYQYPGNGGGWVFACSIYDDWGSYRGQTSTDALTLVQNLLTWAIPSSGETSDTEIPQFSPGEPIIMDLELTNPTSYEVHGVTFRLVSPGRIINGEPKSFPVSILPGETISFPYSIPVQALTLPEPYAPEANLGIWRIDAVFHPTPDYILPEQSDRLFRQVARFCITDPVEITGTGRELSLSITAPRSEFVPYTKASFTFHVYNHSNQTKDVVVRYGMPHHSWESGNSSLYGLWYRHSHSIDGIPPGEERSFTWSIPVFTTDRLWSRLLEDGVIVDTATYPVYRGNPRIEVRIPWEKRYALPGEPFTIPVVLENRENLEWDGYILISAVSSNGKCIYKSEKILFELGEQGIFRVDHLVPDLWEMVSALNGTYGTYQLTIDVYNNNDTHMAAGRDSFVLPKSPLVFETGVPRHLYPGTTETISVQAMNNSSFVPVLAGSLELFLEDPEGSVISLGSREFTLDPGQATEAVFPFTVPGTGQGDYIFSFIYSDEFSQKEWIEKRTNNIYSELVFEQTGNRAGDDLGIRFFQENRGDFSVPLDITMRIPGCDFSTTDSITLEPGDKTRTDYTVPLPLSMEHGMYPVFVDITQAGRTVLSTTWEFFIEDPDIVVNLDQENADAGQQLTLDFSNPGGAAGSAAYMVSLSDNENNNILTMQGSTGTLFPDESEPVILDIPWHVKTSCYYLIITIKNNETGREKKSTFPLNITGLQLEMETYTDKDIYAENEQVTVMTDIHLSQKFPVTTGRLHVEIERAFKEKYSEPFLPGYGLPDDHVYFTCIDDSGNKWFGTRGGLGVLYDNGTPFSTIDDTWINFTADHGLGHDNVLCMTIDKAGYKWFGTGNGLSVLDDNDTPFDRVDDRWHTFFSGIEGEEFPVTALLVDTRNNKWLIGNGQKAAVFIDNGNPFQPEDHQYIEIHDGMYESDVSLHSLAMDTTGNIWISGHSGDGSGGNMIDTFLTVFPEYIPPEAGLEGYTYSIENNSCFQNMCDTVIAINSAGTKWISKGIWTGILNDAGTLVDETDDVWQNFTFNIDLPVYWLEGRQGSEPPYWKLTLDNPITAMTIDADGNKWLARGHYIVVFQDNNAPFQQEDYQWTSFHVNDDPDITATSITIDPFGYKWIASSNGVFVLDDNMTPHQPGDDTWASFQYGGAEVFAKTIHHIAVDTAGRKWVATDNGLFMIDHKGTYFNRFDDETQAFLSVDGLSHDYVNWVAIDESGKKWCATLSGISILDDNNTLGDKTDDTWEYITPYDGLAGDDISCIAIGPGGKKYIATEYGINVLDTGGNISTISLEDGPELIEVQQIIIEENGLIWCVTRNEIIGFREREGTYPVSYDWIEYDRSEHMMCDVLSSLAIDENHYKWIGTYSGVKILDTGEDPFNRQDDNWGAAVSGDEFFVCNSLTTGEEGVMWFGIIGGSDLNIIEYNHRSTPLDPEDDTWTGLRLRERYVSSLAMDNDDVVWAGTAGSLYGIADSGTVIWEHDQDVELGMEENITIINEPDIHGETGKYYVTGTLTNPDQQTLCMSRNPFYIVDFDILIRMEFDKEYYRPGEVIPMIITLSNGSDITYENKQLTVYQDQEDIFISDPFTLGPGEIYTFHTQGTAPVDKSNTFFETVWDNTSMKEEVPVVKPDLLVDVSGPAVVGHEPFPLQIQVINPTVLSIDADVIIETEDGSLEPYSTHLVLEKGNIRIIEQEYILHKQTTFIIGVAGEVEKTILFPVDFGENAHTHFTLDDIYPEGEAVFPYRIDNTGSLPMELEVDIRLTKENSLVYNTQHIHRIPVNTTATGSFSLSLDPGEYTLSFTTPFEAESSSFTVLPAQKMSLEIQTHPKEDNLLPCTALIGNTGYAAFEGSLAVTTSFFTYTLPLTIPGGSEQPCPFSVTLDNAAAGDHTASVILCNTSGTSLIEQSFSLDVTGPDISLKEPSIPAPLAAGQVHSLSFILANNGDQDGKADISFTFGDYKDEQRPGWIESGEEKEQTFTFYLPPGLESGDYSAAWSLDTGDGITHGTMMIPVQGISLGVDARWDNPVYPDGGDAVLTLDLVNQTESNTPQLYIKISYHDEELTHSFTLPASGSMSIDFSLTAREGQDTLVFYGIYDEADNRGIYLNSTYLYTLHNDVTIVPDKSLYIPGETVHANLFTTVSGSLEITAPGFSDILDLTGQDTSFSFTLPPDISRGTHVITYGLAGGIPHTTSFDVNALWIRVTESRLEKKTYNTGDLVNIDLIVSSTEDCDIGLVSFILSPDFEPGDETYTIVSLKARKDNHLSLSVPLETGKSGPHHLVCQFVSPDDPSHYLCSTSEVFDAGVASILALQTDKQRYDSADEPVTARVMLFSGSKISGMLSLLLDDIPLVHQSISLDPGVQSLEIQIPDPVSPSFHKLDAIIDINGITSKASASFLYGHKTADLAVSAPFRITETGAFYKIGVNVWNTGGIPSVPTSVELWQENPDASRFLIAAESLPVLEPGEGIMLEFPWDSSGNQGHYTLTALADPDHLVQEFYKDNNTAETGFMLPGNQPPTAHAGEDVTVEATSVNGAFVTLDGSLSTDPDQDELTYTWVWDQGSSGEINPAIEFPLGTHMVSLWVYDGTEYSHEPGTVTVTVQDTTPPVLIVPDDIVATATGASTPVDIGQAHATDIFPVTITNNAPDSFPTGTTVVTWTAVDENGNTTEARQQVTVKEETQGKVIITLLDSRGNGLPGGEVFYRERCRKCRKRFRMIGVTDINGNVETELNPGRYFFKIRYRGHQRYKFQDTRKDPVVIFRTQKTIIKTLDSKGNGIQGAEIQYYNRSTLQFEKIGMTDETGQVDYELLPGKYLFRMKYRGHQWYRFQHIGRHPVVIFRAREVCIKVLDHKKNGIGGVKIVYYNYSTLQYKEIGFTDENGQVTCELFSGICVFKARHRGRWKRKYQDISRNPVVVFQFRERSLR